MALYFPNSVSVDRFVGGYKGVSDYTDLSDTETADAQNVVYGPNGDIDKRLGSQRLYRYVLTNSSATATGVPITGHYYFTKLGGSATNSYHIVQAGESIYSYNSSTAVAIRTGLSAVSQSYLDVIQIQDPRTPSDDIAIMTNGIDPIQVWNGTGTSINLSSFTSATQVPVCKFILNHKDTIYAIGVVDNADVDALVKVTRSSFGSDGAANPHRFLESFYVGGSNKQGNIQGASILNDQIYFFTRKGAWKFNPSSGSVGDLQELQGSIGVYAPRTLVNTGNFIVFLSEQGVQAFDGSTFAHLSEKVDDDIFGGNITYLKFACATFDKINNQYIISFPSLGTSTRNDKSIAFDFRPTMKIWQPPVTGRQVSCFSTFDDSSGFTRVIYGDYKGFLYQDNVNNSDGRGTGYNGTVSAATINTVTDSGQDFDISQNGLAGLSLLIYQGTGIDQTRIIESNTSSVITLESNFDVPPDTTSRYSIAGIDAHWRSKDFNFGSHDLLKLFRHIRLRVKEFGNFSLTLHYIVDFKDLAQATSRDVTLLEDGMAWGIGVWGSSRWGGRETIRRKISLRNTTAQRLNGTHLAVRFSNRRANEPFRVSGFDVELKEIGKR